MRGILLTQSDNPYLHKQIEDNEFIKQSNSIAIKYSSEGSYSHVDYSDIKNKLNSLSKSGKYSYIIVPLTSTILRNMNYSLSDFGLPVIMYTGNVWGRLFDNEFKSLVEKHKPKVLIMEDRCTELAYKEYLQNNDIKYLWLHFSINPELMRDYGENKVFDMTITGKFSNYIDRRHIHNLLSMKSKRLGINYMRFTKNASIEEYAHRLNKSWMSLSSMQDENKLYYKGHFIGSTFVKNFEIPACKSCLIARKWGDADYLGFKDGENCILFENVKEFFDKLKYYIDGKELLKKITDNGYNLVHKNHTIQKHINGLLKDIENVI